MKKALLVLFALLLTISGLSYADIEDDDFVVYTEKAVVLTVDNMGSDPDQVYDMEQRVMLRVTTGKFKNQTFEVSNILSGNTVYDIPVKANEKVLVHIEEYDDGTVDVFISDYIRDTYIYVLMGLFLLILVLVGKTKGVKTVVTIALTVAMVFKVLLPAILKGYNPVLVTIFVAIAITVITMIFVSGFNKKTIAAIIGTVMGVVVAGVLAFIIGSKVKLTGLSTEEAAMLLYIPQEVNFNFKDLLFSGILLGALGAVMDVAMSIASSIDEIHKANPNVDKVGLFKSGMEVGKDIMGTMSNTLILAYTGSSIPLLLIFMAYDAPMMKMLNLDIIATEIIRSLSGSIGLILTIPITALVAVILTKDEVGKKLKLDKSEETSKLNEI